MVGIFWYAYDTLIYKAKAVSALSADDLGLIDSPFTHIEEWENKQIYLKFHLRLQNTEYQSYPRGRVIYNRLDNDFYVYIDKSIFNKQIIGQIIRQFGLSAFQIKWMQDPHYKTLITAKRLISA